MSRARHGLLVVQHDDRIPAGHLGEAIDEAGWSAQTIRPDRGEPMPDHVDWAGVVSLGGFMGAYDVDLHPWLEDEKRFLATAVSAGTPVLGVCLGCQLLADALGGAAHLAADGYEVTYQEVVLTADGLADPVVSHLDGPVPVWHQDTWQAPPGAVLLAETDRHPQAFRLGSALGIQPHAEAGPDVLAAWLATDERSKLVAAGVDPEQFLEAARSGAAAQRDLARRLFGSWLAALSTEPQRPRS